MFIDHVPDRVGDIGAYGAAFSYFRSYKRTGCKAHIFSVKGIDGDSVLAKFLS